MRSRARPFLRALALRCPLCGTPWRRRGAIDLAARCGRCDLRVDRGEGDYFLGAYTIALFGTLLLAAGLTVGAYAFARTWPVEWLLAIAVVAITAFAVWFYPLSKLVWLAVDVQFRPPEEIDFSDEEHAPDRDRHPWPRA